MLLFCFDVKIFSFIFGTLLQQHRKERRREAEEKRGRGEEKQRREHLAANACGRREVKRF